MMDTNWWEMKAQGEYKRQMFLREARERRLLHQTRATREDSPALIGLPLRRMAQIIRRPTSHGARDQGPGVRDRDRMGAPPSWSVEAK